MLKHQHHHRPNILIIITDQQRSDAIGYINPTVITPNLNKLAKESITCTETYAQSPQCQPSRASILTGRYPTAHQVWWNNTKLALTEKTIGNHLQNHGYTTGYFGKLHIDSDHPHTPQHFGFQHTYLSEDWLELSASTKQILDDYNTPMTTNTWTGQLHSRTLHHEDIITTKAIEFLKTTKGPHLTIVSYKGPHPPYAAPPEFSKLYNPTTFTTPTEKIKNLNNHILTPPEWQELKRQYYATITWIDDNLGRILNTIDHDNTIITFLSDHGDILGDHGLFSKGIYAYDGNIKIPLIIKIPETPPITYHHLTQTIDILPTILNATNIPTPEGIQGKSLLNHFRANTPANPHTISMLGHTERLRMIRTKTYKYWIIKNRENLYDLTTDPTEQHNQAQKPKAQELLHTARYDLLKALINCEDPLPTPNHL